MDFTTASFVFGTSEGDLTFDATADYDANGTIGISDIAIVSFNFGKIGPIDVP